SGQGAHAMSTSYFRGCPGVCLPGFLDTRHLLVGLGSLLFPQEDSMKLNRRDLIKLGAMAGAGVMFLPKKAAVAQPSPALTPFVDALPIPPVIRPGTATVNIQMRQFTQKLHRNLPPTTLWGYNSLYVGPTFEVRSGSPISVQWNNNLPDTHFLPIDH